ncbi:hypothetical protein ANCCEY_02385 [Ancylostoma ceylanicum]|uniref:Ig-like domain-containing protein n=1 Tax=Ancylostoma ceylanicum TaxID=53326 RepID=A0A0D6M362_9BILA|nr:hypothetical protein ANCCEY_02385 [Ancylostoma ceylanicum]
MPAAAWDSLIAPDELVAIAGGLPSYETGVEAHFFEQFGRNRGASRPPRRCGPAERGRIFARTSGASARGGGSGCERVRAGGATHPSATTPRVIINHLRKGDLLMECLLEADPPPTIAWQHSGNVITPSARVVQMLTPQGGILYKANLVIKSRRSPSEKRKDASSPRPPSRGGGSRPGSPKKAMKSREGTPKRGLKEKEGSPAKKSMRFAPCLSTISCRQGLPVPPQADEKKMRTSSPVPEPAKQEIQEKMEKTPTPPKSKSPTPPEPAKQQIPEKMEKTPTPPKSKSPAPTEPEKQQVPEKKDRSPAAPEPKRQPVPEKKDRSPAPPSAQDQAKREKFTRPPIVMEASKSKVGEVAARRDARGDAISCVDSRRRKRPPSRCKVSMCPRFVELQHSEMSAAQGMDRRLRG